MISRQSPHEYRVICKVFRSKELSASFAHFSGMSLQGRARTSSVCNRIQFIKE